MGKTVGIFGPSGDGKTTSIIINKDGSFNEKNIFDEKYSGMNLNGEIITESGILAAAHLSGPESVKTFFKYGKDRTDGNGVRISHYLIKFSGYNLNLE